MPAMWLGEALLYHDCGEHSAKGNWPQEARQANKSSTWRELKAIDRLGTGVLSTLTER